MAQVTLQRFVQELGKLKQDVASGKLKAQDYDTKLARIIQELRVQGLAADRAAVSAALADAVKGGVITAAVEKHLLQRLGLASQADAGA
jgi:hypothetical protein